MLTTAGVVREPAASSQWWEQGLFEWQCEALQGRQELTALRSQHQVLLSALQDLRATVNGPDGAVPSPIDLVQARRAAASAIETARAA